MRWFGTRLLAVLAFAGLQAAVPAWACGCAPFEPNAGRSVPAATSLSAEACTLRDFVLFSHRRIGADLIRKHGPYLDTLSAFFPQCQNAAAKLDWFRQTFASTSDTRLFAEQLALQVDASRECRAPSQ